MSQYATYHVVPFSGTEGGFNVNRTRHGHTDRWAWCSWHESREEAEAEAEKLNRQSRAFALAHAREFQGVAAGIHRLMERKRDAGLAPRLVAEYQYFAALDASQAREALWHAKGWRGDE